MSEIVKTDLPLALAFACKHKNLDVRMNSRSGGVFTAVSDIVLENGGVVFGCALNDSFEAEHQRATTKEERDKFRNSKYVQSDMKDCFRQVKSDLTDGKEVLFSGTPCQVDGLKRYLELTNTNTEKLLTMDLVCHGVPSPLLWRDYLKYQSKKHGTITSANFRNKKKFGWKDHVETLSFGNTDIDSKIFTTLFYADYPLRRSCHECKYMSKNRVGDITLADFWGIKKVLPDYDDNKGVSLIFVSSQKGLRIFSQAVENDELESIPVNIDDVYQRALEKPYYYHYKKEEFWDYYKENGFDAVVKRYAIGNPIVPVMKKVLKPLVKRLRG